MSPSSKRSYVCVCVCKLCVRENFHLQTYIFLDHYSTIHELSSENFVIRRPDKLSQSDSTRFSITEFSRKRRTKKNDERGNDEELFSPAGGAQIWRRFLGTRTRMRREQLINFSLLDSALVVARNYFPSLLLVTNIFAFLILLRKLKKIKLNSSRGKVFSLYSTPAPCSGNFSMLWLSIFYFILSRNYPIDSLTHIHTGRHARRSRARKIQIKTKTCR